MVSMVYGSNITCDDASECAQDSSGLSSGDILCRGYKSCYETDLTCSDLCQCNGLLACHGSEITSGGATVCNGEYGCKYAHIDATGIIQCDGEYSCKFTELSSDVNIYCDGEYGCRLSEVFEAYYLYAMGKQSLSDTDIYDVYRIYSYGYNSLLRATINTTGQTSPHGIFSGYYTTYNATYICASDSTCYIYCNQETSCANMTIYNYGTVSVTCDSDYQCPTVEDMSFTSKLSKKEIELKQKELDNLLAYKRENRLKLLKEEKEMDKAKHQQYTLNKDGLSINSNNNGNGNIDAYSLAIGGFAGLVLCGAIVIAANSIKNMSKKTNYRYQSIA